jgi:Retrotransposon gag protein
MKFTQIDFLNNDIPDYPDSDNDSNSGEETTTKEQEVTETTQDIADSSSESNRRTPSPPTQKEVEPEYLAPTTPIDDAMSQLNLNLTQPTNITQVPPLILQSAMATMASQTATARPSQRSGGDGGGGGGGGGRGGGGGGGGGQQAAAPLAPNPPRNSLKGVPPTIFRGDTKMFDTFKQEWRLYRAANINHDDITILYNRVITMLSLIKGPAVSSWVDDYLTTLEGQRLLHGMNDEALWNDFETALNRAFEDTNKIDNAATDLERLKMAQKEEPGKVSPLTKYISKFNKLQRKAGWDANAEGTMRYFRRGLTEGLLYSMLKQLALTPTPWTVGNSWPSNIMMPFDN